MPTYDYQCVKCGKVTERFHSMTQKPRVTCEKCGGTCKKLLGSGAGLIFKGSGFYATDYRSSSYKKAAKGEKEPAAPAKAETKSESKPTKAAD